MIQNQVMGFLDNAFGKCGSSANSERQAGQNELKFLKTQSDYSLALLNYIQATPVAQKRLRAAIELKLWMVAYKELELFEIEQYLKIMEQVKSRIIDLYLEASPHVADQLSEAIVNLAAMEFPDRWLALMQILVGRVGQSPAHTLRVLTLMTMLTYRYTYSSRSDPLYSEIILVCDDTHDFLLRVTESVLECLQNNQPDAENFHAILRMSMRLFYNLNYQDLHPLFEENLKKWMDILVKVMRLSGQGLKLLKAKSETLKCILLYASKYKQDIQPIIKDFSEQIWKLCSTTKGDDDTSEKILLIALKYFRHLIACQDMKQFFAQNLQTLLKTLIFPSIGFNKTTVVMFEDEPTLFIENYFENSEINTRRSTAIELLKTITRCYNFTDLLKKQLVEYVQITQAQGKNVQGECMILNLVIDSGTVAFRSVDGVTQISISEEIIQYVYLEIVKPFFRSVYEWVTAHPDKKVQPNFNLLHISIHLRYVFFYRLYIPKEDLQTIVRFCCCLNTNSSTFRSIVCMLLQAIIDIRFGDYTYYNNLVPFFDEEKLDVLAFQILKMIFTNEQQQKELNKYLTKTLFVLCKSLKERTIKYVDHFTAVITNMLKKTESYDFKCVVFLFEALSTLMYYMLIQNVDIKGIQAIVDAYFNKILKQGSDLLNFVFQIFSLVVQVKNQVSNSYTALYTSVLSSNNWVASNSSLFTAYVQYLTSFLRKHPSQILSDKTQIEFILTKLLQLKDYRHFSSFLSGILEITTLDGFYKSGYLPILLQGTSFILNEPQPRTSVLKSAILLFCSIISDYDARKVVEYSNQISPLYVENLMIRGLSIISMIQLRDERRLVFQGISTLIGLNLLSSTERWAVMLNALIQNTNRRYIGRTTSLGENQDTDSAYQKLTVFKLVHNKPSTLTTDQERFFVDNFKSVYEGMQGKVNIAQLIPQKSQQQLTRLINKYQQHA